MLSGDEVSAIHRTTSSPRKRMSLDDDPTSTRNVPGSTTQRMSASSICSSDFDSVNATSRCSPGAKMNA